MPEVRVLVLSSLFPNSHEPQAGIFVRERMFRVAQRLPLCVVAPVPWFPLQRALGLFKRNFRPQPARYELQDGIAIYRPRYLSVPGLLKSLDGWLMALGSLGTLRRLSLEFRFDLIDSHFAYPDGCAASWLARWLGRPFTVTLRGTESRVLRARLRRRLVESTLKRASRVITVSESLRRLAQEHGVPDAALTVIPNGVDCGRFEPVAKDAARSALGVPADAKVLITVGGLTERKGFHRVIELMPNLLKAFPTLHYLVVGGASAEGDWERRLKAVASELGVEERVRFLGPMPQAELPVPLSAADLFVLSTRNEGWANVLLEAMACGLPVVTTDVGGNREVVCREELGAVVPFGDKAALAEALCAGLHRKWDVCAIRAYARTNSWDRRITVLQAVLEGAAGGSDWPGAGG